MNKVCREINTNLENAIGLLSTLNSASDLIGSETLSNKLVGVLSRLREVRDGVADVEEKLSQMCAVVNVKAMVLDDPPEDRKPMSLIDGDYLDEHPF